MDEIIYRGMKKLIKRSDINQDGEATVADFNRNN